MRCRQGLSVTVKMGSWAVSEGSCADTKTQFTASKTKAAIEGGMSVIFCCGESLEVSFPSIPDSHYVGTVLMDDDSNVKQAKPSPS